MSTLYLVRHGQASFGSANYDQLSELGKKQMRLLGEFWLRWGIKIDAVYTGSLVRQKDSAKAVMEEFKAKGNHFPELIVLDEFNEYDTRHILTRSLSTVLAENPEIFKILKEMTPDGRVDFLNDKKAFQRLFARVMDLWVDDKLNLPGMERWGEFVRRVEKGIEKVIAEHSQGKTVAVFSSGGPISVGMKKALGLLDKTALELGWVIANGSITEFRYSGDKFSLVGFNSLPHLAEPELISYR